MTCFYVSFVVEICHFVLLMLNFVIVFWGSGILLGTLTVITQWSQLEGLRVTSKDRMGCKEGDAYF